MAFLVGILAVNIYLFFLFKKGPLRLKKLLAQSKAWQVIYIGIASFAFPQIISMFSGLGMVVLMMILGIEDPLGPQNENNFLVYLLVANNALAILLAFMFNFLWVFDKKKRNLKSA